jgi:hypothetical protein
VDSAHYEPTRAGASRSCRLQIGRSGRRSGALCRVSDRRLRRRSRGRVRPQGTRTDELPGHRDRLERGDVYHLNRAGEYGRRIAHRAHSQLRRASTQLPQDDDTGNRQAAAHDARLRRVARVVVKRFTEGRRGSREAGVRPTGDGQAALRRPSPVCTLLLREQGDLGPSRPASRQGRR